MTTSVFIHKLLSDVSSCPVCICIQISHLKIDLASISLLTLSYALLSFVYGTPPTLTCISFLKLTKLFSTSGLLHMLYLPPESLFPLCLYAYLLLNLRSPFTFNLPRGISLDYNNLSGHHSVILYDHSLLLSSQSL